MKLVTAFRLGRISNLPTVFSNVLAGAALAGATLGSQELGVAWWLQVSALASLFYLGGMFLNDFYDRRFDEQNSRQRPIPAGEASAKEVRFWGFAMLVGGIVGAQVLATKLDAGMTPALVSVLLAGCILHYNRHHKNNPRAPFWMGMCRMGVYLLAASLLPSSDAEASRMWPVLAGGALLLGYIVALTHAAKNEHKGLFRSGAYTLGLLLPLWAYRPELSFWMLRLDVLVWCFAAIWMLRAWQKLKQGGPMIPQGITALIAGISLIDSLALLSVSVGLPWVGLTLVAFVATRWLQRFIAGT